MRARLQIDTSTLGAQRVLDEPIIDAVTAALADQGVVVDPQGSTAIEIDIRRIEEDSIADFFVDIKLVREGEPTQVLGRTPCAKCIDTFLVEHVVGRVPQIAKQLGPVPATDEPAAAALQVGEGSAAQPQAETSLDEPEVKGTPSPTNDRTSVALFVAGSACVGLGLGALIGGAVAWAHGPRVGVATADPTKLDVSDHREIGYALVGVGAVLLVGGATMIGIGAVRRSQGHHARAWLAPSIGRQSWGLALSGQF